MSYRLHSKLSFLIIMVLVAGVAAMGGERIDSSEKSGLQPEATSDELTDVSRENVLLREKVAVLEATVARNQNILAIANREAELFQRQTNELKLRLEALGIASLGNDTPALEQRLLKAVNDLRIAQKQNKKLIAAVLGFSDSVLNFLGTVGSPDPRMLATLQNALSNVEGEMADCISHAESKITTDLVAEGRIISIKNDLNLVVTDLGSKSGALPGMPFRVSRNGKRLATLRAVDVREKVAGAVVQDLDNQSENIRIGDRVVVAAQQ